MDVSTAPKCRNCGRDIYKPARGRWAHRNAVVGCSQAAPAEETRQRPLGSTGEQVYPTDPRGDAMQP